MDNNLTPHEALAIAQELEDKIANYKEYMSTRVFKDPVDKEWFTKRIETLEAVQQKMLRITNEIPKPLKKNRDILYTCIVLCIILLIAYYYLILSNTHG